jgi:hypothetical protein
MSTRSQHFVRTFVLSAGLMVTAHAAEEVSNPTKRIDALAQAKALLGAKDTSVAAKDPFHSEAFVEALSLASGRGAPTDAGPVRPAQGPRSNRDLLQAIASSLKPSGFFVLSGEPTLVFGQKRVKAGGTLSIRFEDTDYTLEIVSIERPNFTLRLNREEFTRPIK